MEVVDDCASEMSLLLFMVDLLRCFLCVDEVAAYEKRLAEKELAGEK